MLLKPGGPGSINPRRLAGCGFIAGMVLAPFLALIYGWNAGLGVMAFALAATTYLAFDSARSAPPELQPHLRLLVGLNTALALACLAVLLARLS